MNTWTPAGQIRVGDDLYHDGRESRVISIVRVGRSEVQIALANNTRIGSKVWSEFVVVGSVAREAA